MMVSFVDRRGFRREITIRRREDHYAIFVDNCFYCTVDSRAEASEEIDALIEQEGYHAAAI